MEIRLLKKSEIGEWLQFRERLWPEFSREELSAEISWMLNDPKRFAVHVAEMDDGELTGFVEVSIREWAEGCKTQPVGYIEAWYVNPEHRRGGIGRGLIQAAEKWALSKGCTEMASDADISNDISHRAHAALGYAEVGRSVLFKKVLHDEGDCHPE